MANTLNPYPTDLNTPAQILLTRFGAAPAPLAEQAHACYQILGVGLGQTLPDGGAGGGGVVKSIWDRPDGMKCPAPEQCKAALEEACKMHGAVGDWFKSAQGQQILQMALALLPTLLASL